MLARNNSCHSSRCRGRFQSRHSALSDSLGRRDWRVFHHLLAARRAQLPEGMLFASFVKKCCVVPVQSGNDTRRTRGSPAPLRSLP